MIESLRAVSSLIVSFFILMTGYGLASYIIPLRALGEGWTARDIAQIGAAYSVGYTLASLATPRFIRATGHVRVFAANIAMMVVSILLCSLVTNVWAWMAFRVLFGFAIAGTYMIMESWLNEKSANEFRGFMFSVYMVTAMTGSVAGTYVVPLGDVMTTALFIVAALILVSAVFPIALTSTSTPSVPTSVGFDLKSLLRRSPVAFIGTLLSGVIIGAWLNFSAVYARLSDLIDRRIVMVLSCVLGILATSWLMLLDRSHEYQFYAAACIAGMAIFPIYSLNVAHANDMAEPDEYVRVSSGITVLYGIGIIIGPLIGGQAISLAGPRGLPAVLAIFFAVYAAYAGYRILKRPAALRVISTQE